MKISFNPETIENLAANGKRGNSKKDEDATHKVPQGSVHPSDSDILMNKSDSDDALFITDSSDDIMDDVMPDFSPAKNRIEQTRETIMESLVQSFASISPGNLNGACESNETANEPETTINVSSYDAIDVISVQQDMQSLRGMIQMRRMPSDSAIVDFQRNAGDLASVERCRYRSHSRSRFVVL